MRTQQDRTIRGYNLHICDRWDCNEQGYPTVQPTNARPKKLITFCAGAKDKDGYAHFFMDDYRFERLWRVPERYIDALMKYDGVLSPDFSMYTDMPLPMQAWNHYRGLALAQYWQSNGIDVIPTLCWADEESFDFAFSGVPERSTVAVSTVGVVRNEEARELFERGLRESISRLRPQRIIWYGKPLELGPLGTEVVYYANDNQERVKKWEEEARQVAEASSKRQTHSYKG